MQIGWIPMLFLLMNFGLLGVSSSLAAEKTGNQFILDFTSGGYNLALGQASASHSVISSEGIMCYGDPNGIHFYGTISTAIVREIREAMNKNNVYKLKDAYQDQSMDAATEN